MIEEYLSKVKLYKDIINNDDVVIKNATTDFLLSSIITEYYEKNNNIFAIFPNLYEAQKAYDKLTNIVDDENVLFFPGDELVAAEILNVSGDFKFERINTIYSLLKEDRKYIVVMNVNSAIKYQVNKDKWLSSIFNLNKEQIIEPSDLINKLSSIGYKRTYTVTRTGEFSNRGEIIDIFPLNFTNPIRVDFFDNEIDTIKEFDVDTQKSLHDINNVEIIPVTELYYSDDELKEAVEKINKFKLDEKCSLDEVNKIDKDLLDFNLRQNLDNLMRYISFFDDNKMSILDFSKNRRVYLIDMQNLVDTYDHMITDLKEYCDSVKGYSLLKLEYFMSLDKLLSYQNVASDGLAEYFKDGLYPYLNTIEDMKANPLEIAKNTKEYLKNGILILTVKNQIRYERLKEIFLEESIPYSSVKSASEIKKNQANIIYGQDFVTISILDKEINIINEDTLFENKYVLRKPKYKSIYKNTTKISHYNELKQGDYVVHFDYGIGIYNGLKTIDNAGIKRDYLEITYAENDTLYVPIEQINRIEKYNNISDNVKITKLRTGQWEKAKERVRKKVHDISDKLIKLYAKRGSSVGFSCAPDNNEQINFEAKFLYELTKDQEKAINDVKADMESDRVMDRLICGDVGYGKTEVALRAAFKAVQNGKQVALLCPTTILSSQHYNTFKNRMEEFGVEIELLNRFVPLKKQKEIFKRIESGQCDIVIGTHRLLSSDIKYHDLGLLIIDEEQRFGVIHKEKIRQLKVNVDTITLSATPIPRTLQMSIAGIKDLSIIETPPRNRYPVQTYVLERNDAIIRDAILREMARGGQVYYMYNLVESINTVADKIHRLVPDARIVVGHGKMEKNDLEDVIKDFTEKKYDVLVCTTIIETGIDISDCNTLIVHDSNRLGLSQLYQLRGRVGRSDRIAYAYMMYEPKRTLTDEAIKRLEAIKEFNELGSGYKIAMRDLAIRGAGDILGDEQSGFITSIGLETYLEILNEEIEKIKHPINEDINKKPLKAKEILTSRTIDDKYISNDEVKIEIHKKIDKLNSLKGLEELSEELHDRFGDYDESLKYYMYEKLYQYLIEKEDIDNVISNDNEITLFYSKEKTRTLDGNKLFQVANEVSKNIKLNYYNFRIQINLNKRPLKNKKDYLIILSTYLDKVSE